MITLAVIASGSMAMILSAGFMEDTIQQVSESYIRDFLGHIRLVRRGFSEHGVLQPFSYLIENPDALRGKIRDLPHVVAVAPRLHFSGLLSTGERTVSFLGQGVDPLTEAQAGTTQIETGRRLENPKAYEVLLGKGLAKTLRAQVGSSVVLLANTERGAINAVDAAVVGIFGTANQAFDDRVVRMPITLAQSLLRTQGIESLTVFLDQTAHAPRVRESIAQMAQREGMDLEAKIWSELEEADYITKMVAVYRGIFGVIRWILLVIVTLGIMNTMNMAMLERIGEIGTLMAMGTRRRGIGLLFLFEGLALGVLGGLLGCLGGLLIALLVSAIGIPMPTPPQTTIAWTARIAIVPHVFWPAFGLAVATALLSSILPARKASGLEIAEALRHNV